MRIGWLTDIHLNFVAPPEIEAFTNSLVEAGADAWLVGGDIGVASSVARYLSLLADCVNRPLYFVLGNHDFYGGSFESVSRNMRHLAAGSPRLVWLSTAGVVSLTGHTALVGHDSWGDARNGNVWGTTVELNDFYHIAELTDLSREVRIRELNRLGDEAASYLTRTLADALATHEKVICLMHVPPFAESAVYEGGPSTDDWLPYFSCNAVGDVLMNTASRFAERQIHVLCGHTHGSGVYRPLPNLTVTTGGARYGMPAIQGVLDFP